MNRIFAAVIMFACFGHAAAAEFGIGVSAESNEAQIYLPIDIDEKWRIEPSLQYFSSHTSLDNPGQENEAIYSSEALALAIGGFRLLSLRDSIRMYVGGRVAYIKQEGESRFASQPSFSSDADGYRASATLGMEYLINKRFSIGGEAEWFYQEVDGGSAGGLIAFFPGEQTGTDTRLIVRFRF